MKKHEFIVILALLLSTLIGCKGNMHTSIASVERPGPDSSRLLFIGQDLNSINGYLDNCTACPRPDGYITYISLEPLTKKDFYGGLGYAKNKKHYTSRVDWGAGPLNAYSLAKEYPERHLQIGLYMVDQTRNIAQGRLDKEIKHLADFFNQFPTSVFYLRIGYEFDGHWNKYYPNEYVKAYQYIVEMLRKRGVKNVSYVWQACASPIDDLIEGYREDVMDYYPGDRYVDWLAISWFLPPATGPKGATQKELANEVVAIARQKNKPMMVAESANQGYSNSALTKRNITKFLDGPSAENAIQKTAEQIWTEWYAPFFEWIEENGDVVKGLSYINANWDEQPMWSPPYNQGYWGDSRIEVNEEIKKRWIQELSKPFWGK